MRPNKTGQYPVSCSCARPPSPSRPHNEYRGDEFRSGKSFGPRRRRRRSNVRGGAALISGGRRANAAGFMAGRGRRLLPIILLPLTNGTAAAHAENHATPTFRRFMPRRLIVRVHASGCVLFLNTPPTRRRRKSNSAFARRTSPARDRLPHGYRSG